MIRFEYGADPWINVPDNPDWTHAGHAIVIDSQMATGITSTGKGADTVSPSSNAKSDKASSQPSTPSQKLSQAVRAYKFGDRPPAQAGGGKFMGGLFAHRQERSKGSRQEKQQDHEISSYIKAIELTTKNDIMWPQHFAGEEGTGVSGGKRRMV